ncbi:MAG TPA: hypothetical protein VK179_17780 [Bacteroidales bacterium]|nr:hypothetical protein [Bacteroidales bacterium]
MNFNFSATAKHSILLFFAILLVSIPAYSGEWQEEKIRINPEYKITRASDGSVLVTSKDPHSEFKQQFTDFYADLLLAAYRKQSMNYMLESLRRKYYMSEEECRREIKHAVNTLSEWKIILKDKDLAMK